MKFAVSLPDDLFRAIDARARGLRVSRSSLLAEGARTLLARAGRPVEATEAWNRAIARAGQPGDDPDVAVLRRKSKAAVRGRKGSSW